MWALTGEGSDPAKPMQSAFITTANLPSTAGSPQPFRATLSDFDRYQITHLSSNFSVSSYMPQPLDTNLMLLSSLGGWLDARGAWDPPGLSVEEWVHRASMGRDHYVRVVYKGYLFPFGHRVALIKVSERKFHNGRSGTTRIDGNPAYLRQRMFIIVRERERSFVDPQLLTHRPAIDAAAVPVQQRAHRHHASRPTSTRRKARRRRSAATARRCSGPAWAASPLPSAAWPPTSTGGARSSSCR